MIRRMVLMLVLLVAAMFAVGTNGGLASVITVDDEDGIGSMSAPVADGGSTILGC